MTERKKKMVPINEEEVPPQTKIRIVVTIDEKIVEEMRLIHEKEIKVAYEVDRVGPDWSNTVEMLLRKGVKAYKSRSTL
jgi:hypothetical protein